MPEIDLDNLEFFDDEVIKDPNETDDNNIATEEIESLDDIVIESEKDDDDEPEKPEDDDKSTEDDEPETPEDEQNNDDEEDNNFSLLASTLKEEGILTELEDDDLKSVEDYDGFAGLIEKQVSKMFEKKIEEDYGEDGVKLWKYKQDGGDIEEIASIDNELNAINTQLTEDVIEGTDENSALVRQKLIYYDLTNKGYGEDEAKEMVELYIGSGKDISKAKKARENIINTLTAKKANKFEEIENAKIAKAQEQEKSLEELKNKINSYDEIIKELPLDQRMKDRVYTDIISRKATKSGKSMNKIEEWISENPVDSQIKLAYMYEITNGFKNFDFLVKESKTKAAKELSNKIRGGNFTLGKKTKKGGSFSTSDFISPDKW